MNRLLAPAAERNHGVNRCPILDILQGAVALTSAKNFANFPNAMSKIGQLLNSLITPLNNRQTARARNNRAGTRMGPGTEPSNGSRPCHPESHCGPLLPAWRSAAFGAGRGDFPNLT